MMCKIELKSLHYIANHFCLLCVYLVYFKYPKINDIHFINNMKFSILFSVLGFADIQGTHRDCS